MGLMARKMASSATLRDANQHSSFRPYDARKGRIPAILASPMQIQAIDAIQFARLFRFCSAARTNIVRALARTRRRGLDRPLCFRLTSNAKQSSGAAQGLWPGRPFGPNGSIHDDARPARRSAAVRSDEVLGSLARVVRFARCNDDDISAFKARGGKLLWMHGTVDSAVPPQNTIAYYERLVARFGQGPLDEFARFYVAPGFGHGTGNLLWAGMR
jgi:hypothetical protein